VRVIVCPDSFKGSLSAIEAAEAISQGVKKACEGCEVVRIPLADGGEGTVEAVVRVICGEIRRIRVRDPLMREIDSFFGLIDGGQTAVIEMAAASGLGLLLPDERDPAVTTTYGVGQLIEAAVESGARRLIIGVGGSATNDAGAGAIAALGVRFLDAHGCDLPPGGLALAELERIDVSGLRFPVGKVEVLIATDVTNPLCGPDGASLVYGPQKGASPELAVQLDRALRRFADVLADEIGKDVSELRGAGAAGGLGASLAAFLSGRLTSGIDLILDLVGFDEEITHADLVITGEGSVDEQTVFGKTIAGVIKRANAVGVPVVALAGSISGDLTDLHKLGLTSAFSLVPRPMDTREAMENAAKLLEASSFQIMRLFAA
jgi:glycerate kinase